MDDYRVRVAVEVGNEDLMHGTQVFVEAPTPQLAAIAALQASIAPMVQELGITQEEMLMQLKRALDDTMGQVFQAFGIEGSAPGSPGTLMPACTCGHRYDHHDHESGPCQIDECNCQEYQAKENQ